MLMMNACERLVCLLYGIDHNDVNDVRYQLFSTKGAQSHLLPPTGDALYKHLLHANYQARIWRNALEGMAEIATPHGHGRLLNNGALTTDWMDELPTPFSILELMSCCCTKKCEVSRCSCRRNQLPCTDACYCSDDCENQSWENEEILPSD